MSGVKARWRRAWRVARKCLCLVAGNYAGAFGDRIDEQLAGRIRAELTRNVLRHTPAMMLASAVNGVVLVAAMHGSADGWLLTGWVAALTLGIALVVARRVSAHPAARPLHVSARTINRINRNALVAGLTWGATPILFFSDATNGGRIVIACICAGMIGGGASAFASVPTATIAMILPIAAGSAIALHSTSDGSLLLVAALLVCYCAVLIRGAMLHSLTLLRRFVSSLETEQLANRDNLTNLDTRAVFRGAVADALVRLERSKESFAIFLVDIDDLKRVNDQHGHVTGDQLLVAMAGRLQSLKRPGERLSRVSPDTFAIMAPGLAGETTLRACAARIAKALGEPYSLDNRTISISVSVGACAATKGVDAGKVFRNAELALARAQRLGRGACHVFGPADDSAQLERDALEQDLRLALRRGELHLNFQPMYRLATNSVAGFEALLRWRHPTRGAVPPSVFIPIAEECGLIEAIGAWALREAVAAASAWPGHIRVCVNVSAFQLRSRALLDQVAAALEEFGLPPERLEIEITETVLVSEDQGPLEILTALRASGVGLALDDFGVGYSSLGYLRRLPFDRIKIDRSFVTDICVDRDSAAIVKSVIGLAADLGMDVIAEGIETEAQLERLRSLNCPEIQGYLIAKPMPEDQVAGYLRGDLKLAAA